MSREKIGPSFLIALSIFVCIYSFKLKIGSLSNPGSGFYAIHCWAFVWALVTPADC